MKILFVMGVLKSLFKGQANRFPTLQGAIPGGGSFDIELRFASNGVDALDD